MAAAAVARCQGRRAGRAGVSQSLIPEDYLNQVLPLGLLTVDYACATPLLAPREDVAVRIVVEPWLFQGARCNGRQNGMHSDAQRTPLPPMKVYRGRVGWK